jgi:transposase
MITKVQNILRCYAMGMSIKGISSAFELSRNTVRRYVRMFQDSGLSLNQLTIKKNEVFWWLCGRK